ncbi:NADP-dependent oxidoreductase [Mariniluteicoccus endophyticus]
MRQAQIDRFGTADELHMGEGPKPAAAPGRVVVKVVTAGVNPLDYKIRDGSSGMCKAIGPDDFPLVLGREAYGFVEEVGEGVGGFEPGQAVFGVAPPNHPGHCYAEYVSLPAECLSAAPADGDAVTLGGLALVGTTAWIAVHELARVRSGENVLVHGGAGGVGQMMVQMAAAAGADVWATASTRNQDRLRELGATAVDYTQQDFREVTPKMDVILDGVYFDVFEKSLDHLVEGGRIVTLPSLADLAPAQERGIEAHIPKIHALPREMEQLARLVTDGEMSLEVSKVLPLEQVADAHRELETGHARGKIVLKV